MSDFLRFIILELNDICRLTVSDWRSPYGRPYVLVAEAFRDELESVVALDTQDSLSNFDVQCLQVVSLILQMRLGPDKSGMMRSLVSYLLEVSGHAES